MKNLITLIAITLITLTSVGQTLKIIGKVILNGESANRKNSEIRVTLQDRILKDTQVKLDRGKFEYELKLNGVYSLTFEADGYTTKEILVNTKDVPTDRKQYRFVPFLINVNLIPNATDIVTITNMNICEVKFYKYDDDFSYNIN